jgi:antitoxin component HigA of HigAB toxin-antitoxin module
MEGEPMPSVNRKIKLALPTEFEELVRMHPPRPVHDEIGYETAQEMIDSLTSLPTRSKGQAEYLETLTILFSVYEQEAHAIQTSGLSPLAVLKRLMEAHDMSASDLGRLLGERSLGVKILGSQRELSRAHIRKIAQHFGIGADLLL